MVVGEIVPGRPARAVVLADGAPGALAQIRAPALPVLLALPGLLEALDFCGRSRGVAFGRHGRGVGCSRHTAIGCQRAVQVSLPGAETTALLRHPTWRDHSKPGGMEMSRTQGVVSWALQLVVAGILLQTLFFKFTGA